MKSPGFLAGLLLLPVLGSLLALRFRPAELDVRTGQPVSSRRLVTDSLVLPDGQALRLIGVPDIDGHPAFWLAERELSRQAWHLMDPRGPSTVQSVPVSLDEARDFCRWATRQTGRTVRLPTAAEWRWAARAGVPNVPFAWGYDVRRATDMAFNRREPPTRPGPATGLGFRDLAGGLWEWTSEGLALGSAWSEQDPDTLRIDHELTLPDGYSCADVGMRILVEP